MRKIEFRGIYVDIGKFVYGYLIIYKKQGEQEKTVIYDATENGGTYYLVKPETVGQCTGRKDDEGRQVFGGDVVSFLDDSNTRQKGEVMYSDYSCQYVIEAVGGDEEGNQDGALYKDNSYKIIGNIHQNPELLTDPLKK